MSTYQLLVEKSTEAVLVFQDGLLRFANPGVARLVGCSPGELAGVGLSELVHPADQQMVSERDLTAVNRWESPAPCTVRIVHRAGSIQWTEVNTIPITWDGGLATLNSLINITEKRRAEGEIRGLLELMQRAKREWESAVDSVPDLVCLLDDRGRIVRVNRTVEAWGLGRVDTVWGEEFHGFSIRTALIPSAISAASGSRRGKRRCAANATGARCAMMFWGVISS